MGQCKYCGKKGFFLFVDKDGLCKNCGPALLMQVQNSIRVIKESEEIINRSKNVNTRISRCDIILIHLEHLIELERKGIPVLNISSSKLYQYVRNERIKILSESTKKNCDNNKFLEEYQEQERKLRQQRREAGSIDGKHCADYIETVKLLKREKRYQEASKLLLKLIDAVERETKVMHESYGGNYYCAPWYHEQLSIVYYREKQYDDVIAILERLQKQNKSLHESAMKRLIKARELCRAKK